MRHPLQPKYVEFADRLRQRMESVGIRTNGEFRTRLAAVKCTVTDNMVSRWIHGRGRPRGSNLVAVLDVLGIMDEAERKVWTWDAYLPPPMQSSENRAEDAA